MSHESYRDADAVGAAAAYSVSNCSALLMQLATSLCIP